MSGPATIAGLLRVGAVELGACSESPRLDAELLLGKILSYGRSTLIARGDQPVAAGEERDFHALLHARCSGQPIAYLIGRREFWSLPLAVTTAVLVPRPETEVLVEAVLAHLPVDHPRRVLDLGTGSGAIALALACERPLAAVTATDVSPEALEVARANAASLGQSRILWRRGSWFEAVPGERYDVIVSNPPYIAACDPAIERLAAEPRVALTPGPRGLEALECIVAAAPGHLSGGGLLALEHGSTQAAEVAALLEEHGLREIRSLRDPAGLPRVTLAFLSENTPRTTP